MEPALNSPLLHNRRQDGSVSSAGILSRVFFSWLNPLLATGYKSLERNDIPGLANQDKAEINHRKLSQAWISSGCLSHALLRCYWKPALVTGLFALSKTLVVSCNPLFLHFFTDFASGGEHFRPEQAYLLVAGLLLAKFVECLSQRHWFFGARRLGLNLRSSLITAIYDKELKLSHAARQRHSAGEIVSYISVDAYRLGDFLWWFHQLWTVPLQICIALCILLYTVRWATLSGFLVIALTALLQAPLAKIQQKYQYNFMLAQDQRLRVSTSVLSNMKIIKLQAWECMFKNLIQAYRTTEYRWLYGVRLMWATGSLLFWMSPVVTASIVFLTCIPLGIKLDATLIFTVLATFRVMQEPVRNLPDVLTAAIQAGVSLGRLETFLADEELQRDAVEGEVPVCSSGIVVIIDGGVFGWELGSEKPTLENVNLHVRRGELVAVCGAVGSGKSTLLYSVLGEVPRIAGRVRVRGSIAYVSQTAWIQSGTVRDNILFGFPLERPRYEKVLRACALEEDITSFSHGDLTEIGERGLNLSGGQKQRIQLARALYSDRDIYLLDDPFSAVDAHTGASLFKACILEALAEKTVILVTHQVEFLSSVDIIVVMESGKIAEAGSYAELMRPGAIFERLVNAHEDWILQMESNKDGKEPTNRGRTEFLQRQLSRTQASPSTNYQQLTQEEEISTDESGLKPYQDYINTSKVGNLFMLALFLQVSFISVNIYSNFWLATEVSNPAVRPWLLIGVFAGISFASTGIIYTRSRILVSLNLRASRAFFTGLMDSLFAAPMVVFDSTPLGRILSRVSSDMSAVDSDVTTYLTFTTAGLTDLIGTLVVITIVTWEILFIAVPVLALAWRIQRYYLKTARALVRINGTTKAPILNKTGETVNGAATIRAFDKQEMFKEENMNLVDWDACVSLHTYGGYEWLAMRVELLSAIIVSTAALFIVVFRDRVASGSAGLSLTYAFAMNSCIFLFQSASYLASYIVSVERLGQYMNLPKEAPAVVESNRPPASWPDHGEVELDNLQIKYRDNSPLVIKGISCRFPGGKKVGLVGRTGSGKTTLVSALFRLVEPAGGRILIDNIDITSIGLFELRSRIGVIPQEAFLFRGTVRSNLDPFEQFSDIQIWEVLKKCQLWKTIQETPNRLDTLVTDDGENWSAGQRQLFCLARVLLKRSRLLVLDEATASIDSTTDAILQRVIREEFGNSTVITVAHRIPSVIDCDVVVALRNGHLVECDSPKFLLENKSSLFAILVAEYWSSCKKT